jgi:hypothetical protein
VGGVQVTESAPSHFASSATLMESSLGGSRFTGYLGSKLRGEVGSGMLSVIVTFVVFGLRLNGEAAVFLVVEMLLCVMLWP